MARMTKCIVCTKVVSKRSTLHMKLADGREGRVCRTHDEVVQMLEKKEIKRRSRLARAEERAEAKRKRDALTAEEREEIQRKAEFAAMVEAAPMLVRMTHTATRIDGGSIFKSLEGKGFSPAQIETVKEQVMLMGGLMISEEEVLANPGLAEELNEMKRKIAAKRALH